MPGVGNKRPPPPPSPPQTLYAFTLAEMGGNILTGDENEMDEREVEDEERSHVERLSWVTVRSRRLEKARVNPGAREYFSRPVSAFRPRSAWPSLA